MQVARLLDDADGRLVAARVAADGAERLVGLGQVEADLAVADLLLGGADRLGQLEGLLGGALEEVMGQPLGGLGPDAGQPPEGGDQPIDGRRVSGARHRQASLAAGAGRAAQVGEQARRQPAGQRGERLGRRLAGLGQRRR